MSSTAPIDIPAKLHKYLFKLNDDSKIEKYLTKISQLNVTLQILFGMPYAFKIIKKLSRDPTFGPQAQQIVDGWGAQVLLLDPSITSSSSSSVSSGSSRKRRMMTTDDECKRAKMDSDRAEEGRNYYARMDEQIRRGTAILRSQQVISSPRQPPAFNLDAECQSVIHSLSNSVAELRTIVQGRNARTTGGQ